MKAGIGWPIGVVVILGATVVANIAVMRIANDDPSFAVEPNYYARAVAFDSTMAQERRSLALGWGVETSIDPLVAGQSARVVVRLRDAASAPLAKAQVTVLARFNARANDTLAATLQEDTEGVYSAMLPITTPGEWELRVDAQRTSPRDVGQDTARYTASTRVTVVRASAP